MQNKQTTSLCRAGKDYVTIVKQACNKVTGFTELYHDLPSSPYKQSWVVFAKQPFGSPHGVIEYLGRYTHKIAISNYRLQKHENGKVDFTCKDYKQGSVTKTMQLADMEFIRRFSLHILPRGFVRIHHYGILSSSKGKCAVLINAQLPPIKTPAYIKLKPKPGGVFENVRLEPMPEIVLKAEDNN